MGIPESGPGWMETEVAECMVSLLRGQFSHAEKMAITLAEAARNENLDAIVCECFTLLAQLSVDQGIMTKALPTSVRLYEPMKTEPA